VLHQLGSLPRRLRWALQRWSSAADREFHDSLFSEQRYDPFTFAYPGYITIRRFADLAAERLDGVRHAVDLGCGPGEITCELARRKPEITFVGVDHSGAAIARAREHVAALKLTNVTFEAADIATYTPQPAADIVLMFDSFHHLLDPAAFVRTAGRTTGRFLLIEPGGDWLGGWERTLDLDWVVPAIDTIRARLVWQMGDTIPESGIRGSGSKVRLKPDTTGTAGTAGPQDGGKAVEHRYTIDDFKQFFEGFGLNVRGTIAGIESYPPDPYARPPLRDELGRVTYDLIAGIEEVLVRNNLDLHAKHWVIYAERAAPHSLRTPRPINPREAEPAHRLQGPYDVDYISYDGPRATFAGSTVLASVTFRNNGWRTWSSSDPSAPIHLSYHWLDAGDAVAIDDGVRTPLPHAVVPGETCVMTCRIEAPAEPGRYTLAIDLVEEGVTWFSRAGAPLLRIPIVIR
jgi:SAM-dependent methyltransferase